TGILIKLADLHNTSTDYLLNRTNRKKPYPKN
ncbi:MAG TPA: transcriptional regulator, partial [Negativicutes bacterium]